MSGINLPNWLTKIEEKAKSATPGPWVTYRKSLLGRTKESIGSWVSNAPINKDEDREFIAASRTAVPKLIEAYKVMWEALEDITKHCGLDESTPGEAIALAFNLRAHQALEKVSKLNEEEK